MKFLIVIVVVFVVIWLIRAGARRDVADAPPKARRAPPAAPQDMVECPVCHVHLPRADALPGPGGQSFCCAEHRLRAGG